MKTFSLSLLFGSLLYSCLNAVVYAAANRLQPEKRQASGGRLVFAHFMIGIMSNRGSPSDYDYDMKLAKQYGIDAFALNIGVDPYTNAQLDLAYQSAANNGMKVFISFDFNWWNTGQAVQIGQLVANYGVRPAQLKVDGKTSSQMFKVFVSSFAGDGIDVAALKYAATQSSAGMQVMFVPNFHPGQGDFNAIDGALNWLAWPNNGFNKAPDGRGNHSVLDGDHDYMNALKGKPYLAPVSPWFFTHFGPEVPYSKNWVFPSDLLWFERWEQLLSLGARWVELVTWNDYFSGESHYLGPLSSTHTDDNASKWVNDKQAGATSVKSYITEDKIVYWYRHNKRNLNCDGTDTTLVAANNASGNYFMGRPYGWESMQDEVFVVALLTSAGTITINSGSNTKSYSAPQGATAYRVPMGIGQQSFALARNGRNVLAGVSLRNIDEVCNCGIYNFNPYVGSLPDSFRDLLGPPGINSLAFGLHVNTCAPSPSWWTADFNFVQPASNDNPANYFVANATTYYHNPTDEPAHYDNTHDDDTTANLIWVLYNHSVIANLPNELPDARVRLVGSNRPSNA
ncbi:glycosyl hydrolase family 71-domain-containing protein [Crepidotus variabilis]|uniref:Glycosyl hydrolase family 71-domain-containing protein n=1 Tax=Crepidotus variabilis TaxID=179855 RepID=A0A9P6JL04_9AGAR|nr:glycosyl hydrolase family 71-domain-containing protein [Crepidotus variabilis]